MNNGRKKKARELLQPFLIRRLCLNFLSSEFTVVPLSVFFRIKEDFLRSDKMEERGGGAEGTAECKAGAQRSSRDGNDCKMKACILTRTQKHTTSTTHP